MGIDYIFTSIYASGLYTFSKEQPQKWDYLIEKNMGRKSENLALCRTFYPPKNVIHRNNIRYDIHIQQEFPL